MLKKTIALAALLTLGMSVGATADEWWSHYDRNHDGHWNYTEFRNAHRAWCHKHPGAAECWSDKELHKKWAELDAEHHGWVTSEQMRSLHAW